MCPRDTVGPNRPAGTGLQPRNRSGQPRWHRTSLQRGKVSRSAPAAVHPLKQQHSISSGQAETVLQLFLRLVHSQRHFKDELDGKTLGPFAGCCGHLFSVGLDWSGLEREEDGVLGKGGVREIDIVGQVNRKWDKQARLIYIRLISLKTSRFGTSCTDNLIHLKPCKSLIAYGPPFYNARFQQLHAVDDENEGRLRWARWYIYEILIDISTDLIPTLWSLLLYAR